MEIRYGEKENPFQRLQEVMHRKIQRPHHLRLVRPREERQRPGQFQCRQIGSSCCIRSGVSYGHREGMHSNASNWHTTGTLRS